MQPDKNRASSSAFPTTADKVRFLSGPSAYADAPTDVVVIETHMSFVFLAGERAYKFKKPVRFPFLDFSTLHARAINCREEVRLNRRLAPDIYLGIVALTLSADGRLALRGDGIVVEWLVEMRRLPADLMLDRMLVEGRVEETMIDDLCDTLVSFYRRAGRATLTPAEYVARFFREQEENRSVLTRRKFALDHERVPAFLAVFEARLEADRALLEERARLGHIVEGHGDLRPEHICFTAPIAIFDCLEFSRDLRQVDPFDELAYLGVECALIGAPSFGPKLIAKTARRLGEPASDRLIALYTAWRAILRARLAIAHLLDPVPRQPEKWEPLASRYLALAEQALANEPR
jgi:aminoglycoside phosphotransferase family enzyme